MFCESAADFPPHFSLLPCDVVMTGFGELCFSRYTDSERNLIKMDDENNVADGKCNPETDIDTLPRTWGIPELVIDRFKENEIKPNQLNALSEEILKELCPLIGHRIFIQSKLKEYLTAHINLDFDQKYKENSTNFYTKWHPFINKIISIKFDSSRDDTLATLYEKTRQQPDDDQKVPDQIKLLCCLIPPKGRLNKRTKFSTLECIENFIFDVDRFGDMEKKIEDLQVYTIVVV